MEAAHARPPDEPDLHALWARVFEHPDEVTPRQVLADALCEAGDGRGEFLALQLLSDAQRTAARRRRELLVLAEQGALLGFPALPGYRRTLAFWRGLPSEAELRLLDGAEHRPELAPLKRVVVRGCEGDGRVLASRTWRSLERVEGVPPPLLRQLLRGTAPRLQAVLLARQPTDAEVALVTQLAGVQELGWPLTPGWRAAEVDLRRLARLERLTLLGAPPALHVSFLRAHLAAANTVELRAAGDGGLLRAEVRPTTLELAATSKTPRFWDFLRPWLQWLAVVERAAWGRVSVELDGRLVDDAEWHRLASA